MLNWLSYAGAPGNSHSNRYEVLTRCDFNWLFLIISDADWTPFHVPVGHLYIFFGKISIQILCPFLIQFYLSFYSFLRERERERYWEREGERQRDRETESEAGSRIWAVSTNPDAGLKLMNHELMTWAEVRRLTNWATQVPQMSFYIFWILTPYQIYNLQIFSPIW